MRKQPFHTFIIAKISLFKTSFFHLTTSIRENPLLNKGLLLLLFKQKGYQNVLFHRNQPVIP